MPRKKINPSEEPEQTAAMEAEQPGMDAPATLEGPPQDMGAPDNGLPMEMGEQGEIPPMPGDEPTLPGENGGAPRRWWTWMCPGRRWTAARKLNRPWSCLTSYRRVSCPWTGRNPALSGIWMRRP